MQGQRITIGSFSETVNVDQESISNTSGVNEQTSWSNILSPVESRLSFYTGSSSEAACVTGNDAQTFRGWDAGEPSSRLSSQNHLDDDGMKVEHGWASSFDPQARAGSSSEERLSEPTNILFPGRVNMGPSPSSDPIMRRPLFLRSSSHAPQNVNQTGLTMGAGICPNLYKSVESETDHVGTTSGGSDYVEKNNGSASSSLSSWGLSYKRKALEGTSRQSYDGESSSSFHQTGSHYNASSSLSLSPPAYNYATVGSPEHLHPRSGFGVGGSSSDVFPSLGVTGAAENSARSIGLRLNQGIPHDSIPFNLSSMASSRCLNVSSPHPPPRPIPSGDSSDLAALQGQSHVTRVTGLSRNGHPFPWNGSSNSRAGTSNTLISGDRGTALQDEQNLWGISRNNAEHPMFATPFETRSLGQDPTNWSLATTGHMNSTGAGGVPSSSRVGPSSSAHPLTNPSWIPRHNPQAHNLQSLSEFSPWSLFPSVDSESGGHSGHPPQLPSGPSASSREITMSSRLRHVHNQPFPRSAFLVERRSEDVLGPHSLRALAADIEGRHRLISEIRQVLGAMRRGENLRAEDLMLFDPFIYHGMADLHDRHRDMRLDVDNMSYEELLALEERIGDVSTGLNEETILKSMKQREFMSISTQTPTDLEPCCICQEQYGDGDDVGTLDCGHDFHTNCIKQWLMQKNLCPICKTKALHT